MTAAILTDCKSEILEYTKRLCELLADNYKEQTRQSYLGFIQRNPDRDTKYHADCLEQIRNGTYDFKFSTTMEEGNKYIKVTVSFAGSNRSAHCFIDKNNGDVFKAASWKSPAKRVRYNLLNATSRNECFTRADWAGGYLYLRG